MQFITPILWDNGVDAIGDRTPIGSLLNSEEWSDVPVALRERAFFSSQIESIRFLQRSRDFLTNFEANSIETLPNGQTALAAGSRQQFVKDLGDFAVSEGMGPLDPADAGTIKDITSEGRLSLIFDVMTQSANDYSYWKQGMNPDVLDEFPAQRFVREAEVKQPRTVHQMNEGVVMLKSDLDFWLAMNDPSFGGFGVPWGPWGFGSEMGVEDVDRDTSEQLGLLKPGEKVQPVEKDFNDRLEASTKNLDPDMVAKLKDSFGDQVQFDDGTVKWRSTPPEEKPAEPAAPAAPDPASTLVGILSGLGLDDATTATASDMTDLREQLKESNPADATRMIKYIKGAQPSGLLSSDSIQAMAQEFMDFVPEEKLQRLPKLKIDLVKSNSFMGQYGTGGKLDLNYQLLNDETRLRKTLFHELMHWLHREGDQDYRDAIQAHFDQRTAGEKIRAIPGYRGIQGKLDDWYDAYAGTIYPFETKPEGLEVPTRYIEWLAMPPSQMAALWNDDSFRETMKVVLQGLF